MTADRDPEFEAWIEEARRADIVAVAERAVPGLKLRKAGRDRHASCPVCGGKDGNEFILTPDNPDAGKRFLCRKSGEGGDVIAMVRHATGASFTEAVEMATGRPRPGRDPERDGRSSADPEAMRERQEERQERERHEADRAGAARLDRRTKLERQFDNCAPIKGTHAERYLMARGLRLPDWMTADLRFRPDLTYQGYPDAEAAEPVEFGQFPAMIAAIRNVAGAIIGLHRTYLDPERPAKLQPPGDGRRNKARKFSGEAKGGLIRLGPIRPAMAIGEGIETTASWFCLGHGPEDLGFAAAASLGNLTGGGPTIPHPRAAGRKIPGGIPDMDAPGFLLSASVTDLYLLVDADPDPVKVAGGMLMAVRRHRGEGRRVFVSAPPPRPDGRKRDWNDVLLDDVRERVA